MMNKGPGFQSQIQQKPQMSPQSNPRQPVQSFGDGNDHNTNQQQNQAQQMFQSQSQSPPQSPSNPSSIQLFTPEQQALLRIQSMAFKSIYRNKALPPQIQSQLFNPSVAAAFQIAASPAMPNSQLNQQPTGSQPQSRISSTGTSTPQNIPPRIPSAAPDSPNRQRTTPGADSPLVIHRQHSKTPSSPAPRAPSATPNMSNQKMPVAPSPQIPSRQLSNVGTPQQPASSPHLHRPGLPHQPLQTQASSSAIPPRSRQGSKSKARPPIPQPVSSKPASKQPTQTDSQRVTPTQIPLDPSPTQTGSQIVPRQQQPTPNQQLTKPTPSPQPSVPLPPAKTTLEKLGVDGMVDPHTFFTDTIDVSDITPISAKVPFVPSLLPLGVNLEEIKMAREQEVNAKIFDRLVQLSLAVENIKIEDQVKTEKIQIFEDEKKPEIQEISEPNNVFKDPTIKMEGVKSENSVSKLQPKPEVVISHPSLEKKSLIDRYSNLTEDQIDDLIELKSLKLLNQQKALRGDVISNLYYFNSVSMNEQNQIHFTRMKQQILHEAIVTEQFDLNQRAARAQRENEMKRNHLKAMCAHAKDIQSSAIIHHNKRLRLGRSVMSFHSFTEKEEQKRTERTARQRLQALKANDEEAYIKLLDQTKDTRITHLLRQTNSFLDSLAQAVKNQQRQTMSLSTDPIEEEQEPSNDGSDLEEDKEKVDYYAVAHRVKEVVTKQPSILVGGTLKEYQIKGLQWMISLYNNNLNGILADEMGLGKTIQTISLITYLIEAKQVPGPYLVIVPLSTLTNWTLEFERWAPTVKKVVYKGPPAARKHMQNIVKSGDFQVVLTTFEYIIKDKPILSRIKWVHMIIDEGHRMKNSQSKLSYTLTNFYSSKYRLILTGTPLQNNLPELWALLNFVLPKIFNSVKSFDEWFNTPFANTGSQDKMDLSEEETLLIIRRLHKVLRPFLLRRLKKDVEKDLPDKVERVVKCKMSALQSSLYQQILRFKKMFVGEGGNSTGSKGLNNKLMQLKKVCNHPFVFEQVESVINPTKVNNYLLWRSAGKFELLDRILPKFKAMNHRVLIFFQMTQIMDIMEDFMLLLGLKYLRLDGGTKADERSEMLRLFNAPNSPYFAFLLSTRAGGLGLNLQTADTVIIFDTDWNPHQDLQAQDRAHRIGQTKEVRILRLITENSVEETILDRAHQKLDIDGKVIQAGKFDNKSTNEEQEAFLRRLLEQEEMKRMQKSEDDEELDDEELNEILARNDHEREVYRKIDEERNAACPYGKGRKFDRLLSDAELPEMYTESYIEKEAIKEAQVLKVDYSNYGRGARERREVHYDDGLTEEQWVEAIDAEDDTPEDATARKRARIEKRRMNKMRREKDRVTGVGSSPRDDTLSPGFGGDTPIFYGDNNGRASSVGSTGSGAPSAVTGVKRKRGRRPRAEIEAPPSAEITAASAVALSGVVSAPIPLRKKGKGRPPKIKETLTPQARRELNHMMRVLYDHVYRLKDDDGRDRNYLFLELPSKRLYVTYYTIILNPIALDVINKRINNNTYQMLGEFRADFKLMFDNARRYNEEGSQVYDDANVMERELNRKLEELVPGILAQSAAAEAVATANGDASEAQSSNTNGSVANGVANGIKPELNGSTANGGSAAHDDDEYVDDDDDDDEEVVVHGRKRTKITPTGDISLESETRE